MLGDISDIHNPTTIFDVKIQPPFKGPHTAMPFYEVQTPDFTPGYGDIRDDRHAKEHVED